MIVSEGTFSRVVINTENAQGEELGRCWCRKTTVDYLPFQDGSSVVVHYVLGHCLLLAFTCFS